MRKARRKKIGESSVNKLCFGLGRYTHKQLSRRMSFKFHEWHQNWSENHLSPQQYEFANEWMMGGGRLTVGQHHFHRARQREEINIPFTRLSLVRDSFPNLAIKHFNRLQANVKILDATKFESVMKDWLKARPLYSMRFLRRI
ncbi:hypothetical protein J6590_083402 [Homalodisca vitripennis]|nr:hypothetical protein J6590_083402 [Homalodisca vitripennis]